MIVRLARVQPSVRVIRISEHREVQVRVMVRHGDASLLAQVRALEGATVLFDFHMATDGTPHVPEVSVALCVQVSALLDLVRSVDALDGVRLEQVYDFWT